MTRPPPPHTCAGEVEYNEFLEIMTCSLAKMVENSKYKPNENQVSLPWQLGETGREVERASIRAGAHD